MFSLVIRVILQVKRKKLVIQEEATVLHHQKPPFCLLIYTNSCPPSLKLLSPLGKQSSELVTLSGDLGMWQLFNFFKFLEFSPCRSSNMGSCVVLLQKGSLSVNPWLVSLLHSSIQLLGIIDWQHWYDCPERTCSELFNIPPDTKNHFAFEIPMFGNRFRKLTLV